MERRKSRKHKQLKKHRFTNRKRNRNFPVKLDLSTPLDKNVVVIGIIYAVWCPHCKPLVPLKGQLSGKWGQTLRLLKDHNCVYTIIEEQQHVTKIHRINAKLNTQLVADGFPTIFKIQHGQVQYCNEREPRQIADWVMS